MMGASIYGLVSPDTGELRYIGKADKPARRLSSHIRDSRRRNTPLYSWIRKLAAQGKRPEMVVLAEGQEDWAATERDLIGRARRMGFRLLNVADGGDAPKCPQHIAKANAERLNAPELAGYLAMMQALGRVLRSWSVRPDRAGELADLSITVAHLRGLSHKGKVQAGTRWLALNPWSIR